MGRKIAYICSPLRGDYENNLEKARHYSKFAFELGYVPVAPHLLFTQFLDDEDSEEREAGMMLGLDFMDRCDVVLCFGELSEGMRMEVEYAAKIGVPVVRYDSDRNVIEVDNQNNG